jgi:hypothetical protein
MTLDDEEKKKQAMDLYIRALSAAPEALIKSLSGKEYAKHAVDGAKEIEGYLYGTKTDGK